MPRNDVIKISTGMMARELRERSKKYCTLLGSLLKEKCNNETKTLFKIHLC